MNKKYLLVIFTLIILLLSFAFVFREKTVLTACWSKSELAGYKEEKNIKKDLTRKEFKQKLKLQTRVLDEKVSRHLFRSIRRVNLPAEKKYVALTFDLCEANKEITGYDYEIINYLRKKKVKATLFVGGKWMMSHEERTLQLMADPVFEFGNPAWSHKNFSDIDTNEMEKQIVQTQLQYQALRNKLAERLRQCGIDESFMGTIPESMNLFRFPFGTCDTRALETVSSHNLLAIQWDVVSSDPLKNQTAEKIASRVLKKIKPGSIVVFHANGKGYNTAESLKIIIPELEKQGYQFVTVNELLHNADLIESKEICYELKPGDNDVYNKKHPVPVQQESN